MVVSEALALGASAGKARLRWAVLLATLLTAGGACTPEAPSLAPEIGTAVSELAEPVAADLMRTLVSHLTEALESGGPVAAVEFCSEEALPLTHGVAATVEEGFGLKRASFRVRNPLNTPDEAEELALLYFERAIVTDGEAPESFVQRMSESEYRYYRPLFVGEVCTGCHGPRSEMDSELLAILDERYPSDLATGYAPGDFRGVIRVSVPASAIDLPKKG
jgi:hypothetical protein